MIIDIYMFCVKQLMSIEEYIEKFTHQQSYIADVMISTIRKKEIVSFVYDVENTIRQATEDLSDLNHAPFNEALKIIDHLKTEEIIRVKKSRSQAVVIDGLLTVRRQLISHLSYILAFLGKKDFLESA